ncbi:hypothetical protein ACOMHN_013415 [Nucella lapillus]
MALPTMPSYWNSKKGMYERAIVRQRNHDSDFRQKWTETSDYFQKNNVMAAKQTEWGSGKAYQSNCIDTFHKSCERDLKAMNLKKRQDKLRSLLMDESRQYEAELKGMSRNNYERIEEMKDRAEGLKSAREEKRKQVADEKLYEHWQKNNPDIRKVQSEMMKDNAVGHWSHQQEESRLRAEDERRAKEEIEQQMEEERLAALESERQREEEKLREEFELRDHLKRQMTELRDREAEAHDLKQQHDLLLQQHWEMEKLEAKRQHKEDQRKKMDLGRALLRQHKTQMMHKSKLIQEELELDRRLLEDMIEKEHDEISLQTARREKAKADAQWMKQVIEDQLRLEKTREAEMDMLFQDEAARMWQRREGEWERERQARKRLMDEVLEGRQEQIVDKLEEVKRRQQESLERREELLRELEIANQLTQREQKKVQEEQEAFKQELKEQVDEHQTMEKMARLNLHMEDEEDIQADRDYQDFLRQETDRMKQRGYTPTILATEVRRWGHTWNETEVRRGGHTWNETEVRRGGHTWNETEVRRGGHTWNEPEVRRGGHTWNETEVRRWGHTWNETEVRRGGHTLNETEVRRWGHTWNETEVRRWGHTWNETEVRRGGHTWNETEVRRGGHTWNETEVRRGGHTWNETEVRRGGHTWNETEFTGRKQAWS